MFTGLVEAIGQVVAMEPRAVGLRLRVRAAEVLGDAKVGDSICVSGVCLTAVEIAGDEFSADLAPETLRRTSLGNLVVGGTVNLERSLAAGGRLGGHMMQGHVDGLARIVELRELGEGNWWVTVEVPEELERYVVFKGSIALDGISLTVAAVEGRKVSVAIVPHTWSHTTLSAKEVGAMVNVEVDVVAKYVEKMLSAVAIRQA
jgi:riboflavin synthase